LKRLSDQTLYEILEVSVEAPPEEIERAYERASALYGPGSLATYSLVTPDEAQLLNNRIEEAKAVLLDPDARSRYDERIGVRPRAAAPHPPPPAHGVATPWPPPPPVAPAATSPAVTPPAATPPAATPPAAASASAAPQAPSAATPPPEEGIAPPVQPIVLDAPISTPPPGAIEAVVSPLEVATPASPGAAALTASPAAAGPVPPAPIPLKQELPAPRELLVPEGSAWTGQMLRQIREARGLTLPQLSERTKVTRHHLENIEADRFGALPAPVYLRGIIMSLARELRLDGQKVARSYLERQAATLADAGKR
jgi:helix-turn-helix protein/DnaJ-like protein